MGDLFDANAVEMGEELEMRPVVRIEWLEKFEDFARDAAEAKRKTEAASASKRTFGKKRRHGRGREGGTTPGKSPRTPGSVSSGGSGRASAFANGATLECDWVEDAPGGRGVFKVPRGAVYRGPFRDGLFHGKGVLKFGGNTYRGAFRAGAFHGSGTLALAGGDRYEGAFRNHRFHGRGAYFWKSGQRYEGLFEDGAMTGRGVASWPGGQRYAGDYVDGRREGRGDLRGGAGQRYRGEFADGYPHGAGPVSYTHLTLPTKRIV